MKQSCSSKSTSWNSSYMIGVSKFLQSHKVACDSGEVLRGFRLEDNGHKRFPMFRYHYECCTYVLKYAGQDESI